MISALLHNAGSKEGQPKQLGRYEIDISTMMPELIDIHAVGIRRKVEFRRGDPNEPLDPNAPLVGRCLITLKLVGDYLTKFDSLGDGFKGAPKKSMAEIH